MSNLLPTDHAMRFIANPFWIACVLVLLLVKDAVCQDDREQLLDRTDIVRKVRIEGGRLAEDRLIFLDENRHAASTRTIAVSYVRIPARDPTDQLPVFVLPGGPGKLITLDTVVGRLSDSGYSLFAEIAAYSQERDVLVINQRGVAPRPAGPALPKYWRAPPPRDASKPRSLREVSSRFSTALRDALRKCESQKFDLQGYDIDHLVDDVEAIRRAHGYDQIALRGSSFGSQWALAYLARYPANVERMTLAGVEPVDYGYDSADGLWNVIKRVEKDLRGTDLPGMPEAGLTEAIKTIVNRLETKPVRVMGQHPRRGFKVEIEIGADDFRDYLLRPILDSQVHSRMMLSYLPKYVAEVYAGDYEYLAANIVDDRPDGAFNSLVLTLVDHSLGISDERAKKLEAEQARDWLGDVNWLYAATKTERNQSPSIDQLRSVDDSPVPVLLIQGTFDLATPYENACESIQRFPNGKLLTVKGGTHAATFHAASVDDRFTNYLEDFMGSREPKATLKKIPEVIELPALKFVPIEGKTLFQLLTAGSAPN